MRFERIGEWAVAQLAFGLMGALKLLPADAALNLSDRIARRVGRKMHRNKLVVANLRNAFPEKNESEIEALAEGSWANLGRMAAEYVFFDKLFSFEPDAFAKGRVVLEGEEHVQALVAKGRPFIFMTAHTGNFEILPHVARVFGAPIAVLFRPPNNPFIAARILKLRGKGSDMLVPSRGGGSSRALAHQLAANKGIGVLVDQKFSRGVPATFFGLPVHTNPLVPRLARQFHCDVVPARSVRLPGNRFKIIAEAPLELPRTVDGEVDVDKAVQVMNDKVEAWVREFPEQWLWYHDRWNIKKSLR